MIPSDGASASPTRTQMLSWLAAYKLGNLISAGVRWASLT